MDEHDTPWQQLLRYVEWRAPGFRGRVIGATPEEINALFAICPRPLPRAAFELLASIGRYQDVLHPFGQTFITDVDALLDDMEDQYLEERFFRVAIARNEMQLGDSDIFVDLDFSNGYDAPLLEVGVPWDGRVPDARSHSLMSKAVSCAFWDCDIRSRAEYGYVGKAIALTDLPNYTTAFRELTGRMGLRSVLGLREDLQCYVGDDLALMLDAIGPGFPRAPGPTQESLTRRGYVSVWIGVDNFDALRNVAAQVRDHMPPLPFSRRWTGDEPLPEGEREI